MGSVVLITCMAWALPIRWRRADWVNRTFTPALCATEPLAGKGRLESGAAPRAGVRGLWPCSGGWLRLCAILCATRPNPGGSAGIHEYLIMALTCDDTLSGIQVNGFTSTRNA